MISKTSKIGKKVFLGEGTVIDDNVVIEDEVFVGHNVVIRSNVNIGKKSVIGHNVVIEQFTVIGEETTIQSQCHITGYAYIGNRVYFGPCVTLINERRISAFRRDSMDQVLSGPTIGSGCRIGARSLIMPGVHIGENAVIGAGCIITKNVNDYEIWYGQQAELKGVVPLEERI